jgi:hypothetical protein
MLGGKPFAHQLTARSIVHQEGLTNGESSNQEGAGPHSGRIEVNVGESGRNCRRSI